jgi:hypothetical protein
MGLDRPLGDVEPLADPADGVPLGGQAGDLPLPAGE